ncbi:MAG: S41 family peptidase [Bacteroidota bacterium]
MKKLVILITFSALALLSACELVFMQPSAENTPTSVFEEAWSFADREYSFFEFKKINWDSVKAVYEPQVNDSMSQEELFDVLADMLFVLRDGHVNLRSPFDRSRNWRWFLNSPPNFNYDLLERNYFKEQQQFVGNFIVNDFEDVGYARYSSFSNGVSPFMMRYLIDNFSDSTYKGLIFDVRDNGGGSLSNVANILEYFTADTIMAYRDRYKIGPEHNDFSSLVYNAIAPAEDTFYTKPIIVLTNRSSYSATTFFSTATKAFPNITLMGDTTGGGGGAPANTDLPNGWTIRVSSTQLFSINGLNVEDGLPPDVFVQMDSTDIARGEDTILELALKTLREN